jgi:hypothetical protein
VAISEREGGYGRYPIVTIRCADGDEVAVHAFRTVLASRLAEVRPQSGEQLGIKYEGERDGGERRYHSYKVAVDRPERPIDWSTYSEDVPAEPAADVPTDSDGLPGTDEDVPF